MCGKLSDGKGAGPVGGRSCKTSSKKEAGRGESVKRNFPFAMVAIVLKERSRRKIRFEKRSDSWSSKVEGDEKTEAGCRRPDNSTRFARRASRSLDSYTLGVPVCVTCCGENARAAVTEMTKFRTSQNNITTSWDEYARTELPNEVVLLQNVWSQKPKRFWCETAGAIFPLQPEQKDWHWNGECLNSKFCRITTKKGLQRSYYR